MNNMNEQQKSVIDRIRSGELEKPADINTQPEPVQKTDTKPNSAETKKNKKPETPTNDTASAGIRFKQGVSTDISRILRSDLEKAAAATGLDLLINSTTGGSHENNSRHYRKPGAAVDIATINGYSYNSANFKKFGDQLVSKLETMGYKRNAEGDHTKSVLWYMSSKGDSSSRHEDHVHVSNITGTTSTTTPVTNNWKKHNIVEEFGKDLFSFITTDAEKYFEKFKWTWTNWDDDEVNARKYFDKQITQVKTSYGINQAGFMKDLFPQTKHNLKELDDVIKYVGELITKGDQGSKTIKYYYYDKTEKKWKTQNVKFVWDYM
jgi:hypothetical protein